MYRLELGTLFGMPAMGGYSRSPRLDVRLNCLTARAASVRRYGPAAATVGRPKILTNQNRGGSNYASAGFSKPTYRN